MSSRLRIVGNALHVLNILLISCYGTAILIFGQRLQDANRLLDQRWFEEGFCAPTDTAIDQTHLDSGLVLAMIAFPFVFVLYRSASSKEMQEQSDSVNEEEEEWDDDDDDDDEMAMVHNYVSYAMLGLLGHAAGHFLIYESIRIGIYPEGDVRGIDDLKGESIPMVLRKIVPGYIVFWTPLIKSYMQNTRWPIILLLAKVALFGSLLVPLKFGFAFAQCFFFLGLSLDQLFSVPTHKKNFAYALYPLVTVLPSNMLSWLECTSCSSSSLMTSFGHANYDVLMGSSYAIYYMICSWHFKQMKKKID